MKIQRNQVPLPDLHQPIPMICREEWAAVFRPSEQEKRLRDRFSSDLAFYHALINESVVTVTDKQLPRTSEVLLKCMVGNGL